VVPAQVTPIAWDRQDIAVFDPCCLVNPFGYGTAPEILAGAYGFEYLQANSRALIAVKPVQRAGGVRLDVVGLVSTGDRLTAAGIDAAMTNIAARFGANLLTMATMRDHVARVARRAGWIETGVTMIKPIGEKMQ